ncbi:phospholipid/cholesterol/gamma-HCH transport system substrate-binding protein [Nocardioides sp. J9]|uniref:MCE family protein n=1 Tax=unclassified Nocardioides TaxID=2615069 RepID=UPI00048DCEED|nr:MULTISPECIES: MCE family protein [unclassified Nocardioides]TWH00693.1 phospholipid/cholesterol/gamma-HCH transport system substrate-binding protein [Nocardioides sp. J9]
MSRYGVRRALVAATVLIGVGAGAAGCGLELEDVPLPSLVDGPTYELTVEFEDALNLPVDAPVKLDGATVGQVTAVEAGEYVAEVELALSTSVELRDTSRAEIRLTSPMGTAFVQLFPGTGGDVLAAGATLPAAATGSAPDVTDLLSALSTVVTGGSFSDISTIITELNTALTGNAGDVRRLLSRLDTAVTDLDGELPRIDRLTRALDRLTTRLAGDLPEVTRSLTDLTDLVTSFDRQRADLVAAMESLNQFDVVATPLTNAVRSDLLAQLRDMEPVLRTLLAGRRDIDGVMRGLIAFAGGSDVASPGDFVNFDLTVLLDLEALAATGGAHR